MADYKIGTTLSGMTNIESLGVPVPRSRFQAGERVALANGGVRELGWGRAEWEFPILTMTQRNALRNYCPSGSAAVYIRTMTNEDAYANYQAMMIWPEEEDQRAGRVFDLVIRFNLIALET